MGTNNDWSTLCLKAAKLLGDVKNNVRETELFWKSDLFWHQNQMVMFDKENLRAWPAYLQDQAALYSLQTRLPRYVMSEFDKSGRRDRIEHTLCTGWTEEDQTWRVGYMRWGYCPLRERHIQSWAYEREHKELGRALVLIAADLYDNCIELGEPK